MWLQRRNYALLAKTSRKIRDACHKATRKVVEAFPRARIVVGKSLQRGGAEGGSSAGATGVPGLHAEADRDAGLQGRAIVVPEPLQLQTCPVCGCRQTCRRTYRCRSCGFEAPGMWWGVEHPTDRDGRRMVPTPAMVAPKVIFVHPSCVSWRKPGSSGGTPQGCSAAVGLLRSPLQAGEVHRPPTTDPSRAGAWSGMRCQNPSCQNEIAPPRHRWCSVDCWREVYEDAHSATKSRASRPYADVRVRRHLSRWRHPWTDSPGRATRVVR